MNKVIVFGNRELVGKEIVEATNKINKLSDQIKGNYFKIGKILLDIREKKLLRETQFTFADYCEEVVGISISTAYRIMQVAEKIYIPALEDNTREEEGSVNLLDYSDVALSRILTVGDYEEMKNFVYENNITPQTSTRDINAILKVRNTNMQEENEETTEWQEENEETIKQQEEEEETIKQQEEEEENNFTSYVSRLVNLLLDDSLGYEVLLICKQIAERIKNEYDI